MKYTEKYINEMIEYYRNKLYNAKSFAEYEFYLIYIHDWKRRLNKILRG